MTLRGGSTWGLLTVCVIAEMILAGLAAPSHANASEVASNSIERSPDESSGLVKAALQRRCASKYTLTCLKLDALSVLGRMAVPAKYDVLPGVTIRRQADSVLPSELPADLVQSLATDQHVDKRLDEYLMARFGNFLDSHSVQVHLLDLQPVASLRKALGSSEDATGRRKNGIWQQLMGAGMMMGGSTLTMGLSALAAMAGKALMLSMLSLVLSALSGMGGGGGGGGGHSQKQTTYEIISKPIYTHGHSHSAELHHEPSGPAVYGLYGRAKDTDPALSGSLSGSLSGAGASGVGGSALGGAPGPNTYITQFPRSLQESAQQVSSHTKKGDEEKTNSPAAANYDSLLIRNLQYVKGEDGRAKYVATPADLTPSETDYGHDEPASSTTPRKYASQEDPSARSFQLSAGEEEGLVGVYDGGVLAGPRSMHTFTRLPQLLVGQRSRTASFREPLPDISSPGWEAMTTTVTPTTTSQPSVNPAFVVAKPVTLTAAAPSDAPITPRSVAYRAYS